MFIFTVIILRFLYYKHHKILNEYFILKLICFYKFDVLNQKNYYRLNPINKYIYLQLKYNFKKSLISRLKVILNLKNKNKMQFETF